METKTTTRKLVFIACGIFFCSLALTTKAATFQTTKTGTVNWSEYDTWATHLPGSVTRTLGSNVVTGVGTHFLTELHVGDLIVMDDYLNYPRFIQSIVSDTYLTMTTNAIGTVTGTHSIFHGTPGPTDSVIIGSPNFAGVNVTLDTTGVTIAYLKILGTNNANILTHSGTNTLTVTGNAVVEHPASNLITNSWDIAAGIATVNGSLTIGNGTVSAGRVARTSVTTGTLTVIGNLAYSAALSGTSVVDLSGGAGTLNLKGNVTLSSAQGTLTAGTASTVIYCGANAQTVSTAGLIRYCNLHFNNTSVTGVSLANAITSTLVTGDIRVLGGTFNNAGFAIAGVAAKTFEMANGTNFYLSGTSTMPSTFTTYTIGATSTTYYIGTNQTITALTYGNLTTYGSGTKTFQGASTIAGNLNASGSVTLTANGNITVNGNVTTGSGVIYQASNRTHTFKGNWSNNGTFTQATSTVVYAGSAAQAITGVSTYNNLTISNAAGITISNDITINGTLSFSSGRITTGSYMVYIPASGTVSGAAAGRYVNGNLKRDLPLLSTAMTFDVGDATNYTKLAFSSLVISLGGSIKVNSMTGDHPNIASSDFSSGRTVNRYWKITNTGLNLLGGVITATFAPTDGDPGLSTANSQVAFWNGSTWTHPAPGTRTATTTQATGITGTGDVQIGERYPAPTLTSIVPPMGNIYQTMNVILSGTNFYSGVTTLNPGADITVNSVTVSSTTLMTANITIGAAAVQGPRNFTVTNSPGGGTSGPQTFTVNGPSPTLTSISPTSGLLGQTMNVIFTGTNYSGGVSSVNVGSGITVNSTTVNSATQITANITISAAAVAGTRSFYVTNANGGGNSVSQTFTVNNPAPTLTNISPTSGNAGSTYNVTFTGTNFVNGVSSVNVGAGITVNSTTVNSATSITANITIASTAIGGVRAFSVTNASPGGGTTGTINFTVNNLLPTLTSISPASATVGNTLDVTFTGTNFVSGVSSVNVGAAGITVNSTTVNSSTTITANITISLAATTGARNFSVTNAAPAGGTSANRTFTVNQLSPTLTSISPTTGTPGQTLNVIFTGTNFINLVSTVQVGANITINSATVNSSTQITANITIAAAAPSGARNFTVTNGGGGGISGAQVFTVNNLAPTLTSIAANNALVGATLTVTFTGTNFLTGVSSVSCGADITVNSTTVVSATSITANITISGTAAAGTRSFTVTNAAPGGGTTAAQTFTINNPLPTLTSIAATIGIVFQTYNVVFTGTNFISGVSSVNVGAGITVNSTTVTSSTSITANITITAAAASGTRNFTVTNATPGGGTTATKTFTVNNPVPTLTAISPTAAPQGVTVDVYFTGTGFITGTSTVTLGAGLTQNSITVVSSTSMIVNVTVSAIATLGTRNFTVTDAAPGGGTSGIAVFTINNSAPVLTSILPTSGVIGQTLNVSFIGNHIAAPCAGNVGAGITINSTTITPTLLMVLNITITGAAATGNRNFYISNAGVGNSGNAVFAVNNPVPTLTSIAATSGVSGQTLNITFTGTNFINGVSSVTLGADITLNSLTVSSSTSMIANITIAGNATIGTRNFSVTNATPGGGTSGNQTFTISNPAPTLTSISPSSGNIFQTMDVTFTGTNFINGVSSVNLGTGITLNTLIVNSSTSMTANITVSATAASGNRNFSVTNASPGGGTSASQTFTVNNPSPTLTSISPTSGTSGQTLSVTFTGTNFVSGTSSVSVGTGITVNSTTVSNSTTIIASITILSSTGAGSRNFTVTNASPSGGTSAAQNFDITNSSPVLTSISPILGNRLQTLNVTFTGSNFISGVSTVNVPSGITINSQTVNSGFAITANITITGSAATGANHFSVTNAAPGGGTSSNSTFTISNPSPTLSSVSPNTGNHGETLDVVFTGTNFIQGVSSVSMGLGITVNSITVSSATSLTANITISPMAILGARFVSVINQIPGGGISAGAVFTVSANQKTFIAVSGDWNVAANWSPAGVPVIGESVIIPVGSTCFIMSGGLYFVESITIKGVLQILSLGVLGLNGNLNINSTGTLAMEDAFPTFTSLTNSGTIEYTGSNTMVISDLGIPFYDLKFSGTGVKVLGSNITVNNSLYIDGILDAAGNTITVKKNWINNGTFLAKNNTVNFSGAGAQSISGSNETEFYNLNINNISAAGVSLAANENLKGLMTLGIHAKMTTTGYTFRFLSDSTETARLGIVPANATFLGNISMQRYLKGDIGYRMLGSAVANPTLADINDDFQVKGVTGGGCVTCTPNFWFYNETVPGNRNSGFVVPTDISNIVTVGKGMYFKRTSVNPVTLDLTAAPNIGTFAIPVTYTPSVPASSVNDGWNLVSNVFPCDIDWNSPTGWTKTNLTTTFYTWDPVLNDYRYYQTGVGGNTSSIIASSQGFYVQAKAANPALSMNENAKVTSSNNFYRMSSGLADAVSVRITDASDTAKIDNAYLKFSSSTHDNFEPENDSYRLYSDEAIVPDIASMSSDSSLLAINSLSALDHNFHIPLVVRNNSSGNYIISCPDITNFPMSTCVTLEDLLTGTKTDLKAAPYSCTISASSSSAPRFILHIAPPVKMDVRSSSCPDANDGIVIAKGQANGPWSYSWKNASGTVIKSTPPRMSADSMQNLHTGYYSVEVTNAIGICTTVKEEFNVVEPVSIDGNAVTTDVSCHGKSDGKITLFTAGGTAPYHYKWNNGSSSPNQDKIPAGNYNVMITDTNGCIAYTKVTIAEPAGIVLSVFGSDVGACAFANGAAEVVVSGGAGPFTYKWSNDSVTSKVSNLSPGKITVTVTDQNHCSTTENIHIDKARPVSAGFTANADTVFISNGGGIMFMNETEGASSYRWEFGDGANSTEQNPQHMYSSTGSYKVWLVAFANGCVDSTSMNVIVINKEGEENNEMTISPNPNAGDYVRLSIKNPEGSDMMVIIYDESGKIMMSKTVQRNNNQFILDLTAGGKSKLQPGIYMISAVLNGSSFSKKLIVNGRN